MWIITVLSLVLLLFFCSICIWFYLNQKNKIKIKGTKKVISKKEYRREIEEKNKFISDTEKDILKMINDFIVESKNEFDNEEDYEQKKYILADIKKDISLLTNSFLWLRLESLDIDDEIYKLKIKQLKTQRPSKWTKIDPIEIQK